MSFLLEASPSPNVQVSAHEIEHVGKFKYFSRELTDGEKKVCFVRFDSKLHNKMSAFYEKEAISESNCKLKKRKYCIELEVVIK